MDKQRLEHKRRPGEGGDLSDEAQCLRPRWLAPSLAMFQEKPAVDGVLQLDAVADELVHEQFTCDTRDHEDHVRCDSRPTPPTDSHAPTRFLSPGNPSCRRRFAG